MEWLISLAYVSTSVGSFCVGYLWGSKSSLQWKIRWIELEHDSSKKENRIPRNINEVFPNG